MINTNFRIENAHFEKVLPTTTKIYINFKLFKPRYEQNRKEVGQTKSKVQGKSPLPFSLKPLKPKENRPYGDLRSYNNAVIQKCPLYILEDVLPTPVMQYWTHTEVNLVVKFWFWYRD